MQVANSSKPQYSFCIQPQELELFVTFYLPPLLNSFKLSFEYLMKEKYWNCLPSSLKKQMNLIQMHFKSLQLL